MNPIARSSKNLSRRTVFIKNKTHNAVAPLRQIIELCVMLFTGVGILFYLNQLPGRSGWSEQITKAWILLLDSIINIMHASITFLISISLIFAIIIAIVLVLGSLIRFLRLMSFLKYRKKKNNINRSL